MHADAKNAAPPSWKCVLWTIPRSWKSVGFLKVRLGTLVDPRELWLLLPVPQAAGLSLSPQCDDFQGCSSGLEGRWYWDVFVSRSFSWCFQVVCGVTIAAPAFLQQKQTPQSSSAQWCGSTCLYYNIPGGFSLVTASAHPFSLLPMHGSMYNTTVSVYYHSHFFWCHLKLVSVLYNFSVSVKIFFSDFLVSPQLWLIECFVCCVF